MPGGVHDREGVDDTNVTKVLAQARNVGRSGRALAGARIGRVPVATKLQIKDGMSVAVLNAPADVDLELPPD